MMEVRPLLALLLAAALTGSDAQSDVCGLAPLNPITRMVGGEQAAVGAWPWQVILSNGCGGSLITDQWVLTAASCFLSSDNVSVILGTNTLDTLSNSSVVRSASRVELHPVYSSQALDHNVALLLLSSPVNFTDHIRPVCLASEDSAIAVGTTMWITGWGYMYMGVNLPPPRWLQQVTVPVMSNQECDQTYLTVTEDMMCAGGQAGRGPCNGDGGGPLVLRSGSRWVQAGVLSFLSQNRCRRGNAPIGFSRVSRYQRWISSVTDGDQPGFIRAGAPSPAPVAPLLGAALVLSSVLTQMP
ncbi:uncharacterized protein V6R79_024150 [Siganus canaliculatus]